MGRGGQGYLLKESKRAYCGNDLKTEVKVQHGRSNRCLSLHGVPEVGSYISRYNNLSVGLLQQKSKNPRVGVEKFSGWITLGWESHKETVTEGQGARELRPSLFPCNHEYP